MRVFAGLLAVGGLLLLGIGCGSDSSSEAEQTVAECHPSYEGACLDPTAADYDCKGGSGDGPLYTGPVAVVGPDEYGLDRNGDGSGCESS